VHPLLKKNPGPAPELVYLINKYPPRDPRYRFLTTLKQKFGEIINYYQFSRSLDNFPLVYSNGFQIASKWTVKAKQIESGAIEITRVKEP